jgi:hypothetical protein
MTHETFLTARFFSFRLSFFEFPDGESCKASNPPRMSPDLTDSFAVLP